MGHVLDKRVLRWIGTVVFWAVAATVTFAQTEPQQQGKTTAVPVTPPKNLVPSDVKMPLLDQPLRLSDFTGMQPREDLREKLGHVENFIQNQPADGKPATEKTEVWMGHTQTALYFVFLCFDRPAEPGSYDLHARAGCRVWMQYKPASPCTRSRLSERWAAVLRESELSTALLRGP